MCSQSQFLILGLCWSSDFSVGRLNSPYGIECVQNRDKMYANRHKHTQSFYMVCQLPRSTGLCPDARISLMWYETRFTISLMWYETPSLPTTLFEM